jgi:hypothetical protein
MTLWLYHKIDSVFKRDPETKHRTFLVGQWSRPEFGYLADLAWDGTEKVDGTNVRIHLTDGAFYVGGRTERADLPKPLTASLDEVGERALAELPSGLTLYGEGYGAKIQKGGGDYRQDQGFILFDVMTSDGMFLQRADVEDIAGKIGVPVTPVLFRGSLWDAIADLEDPAVAPWSKVAEQPIPVEGYVLRPQVELRNRQGQRVITKLKVRDFRAARDEIEDVAQQRDLWKSEYDRVTAEVERLRGMLGEDRKALVAHIEGARAEVDRLNAVNHGLTAEVETLRERNNELHARTWEAEEVASELRAVRGEIERNR